MSSQTTTSASKIGHVRISNYLVGCHEKPSVISAQSQSVLDIPPRKWSTMKHTKLRWSVVGSAVAVMTILASAMPAASAEVDPASPEYIHSQVVGDNLFSDVPTTPVSIDVVSPTARGPVVAGTVRCSVAADKPHHSSGANGHIYKTRINCAGTGTYPPTVTILVRGALMWDSAQYNGDTSNGIVWSALRTSSESRVVSTNGVTETFYTPQLGTSGAYFTGHYQGSSTVQITSLGGSNVGSAISQIDFRA